MFQEVSARERIDGKGSMVLREVQLRMSEYMGTAPQSP